MTDITDAAHALQEVRDTLRSTISALTCGAISDRSRTQELLGTAREIQRLVDTTITELISAARQDPASPPLETLLGDRGAIPRNQVQAELDRVRIHDTFPAVAHQRRIGSARTANVDILARLTRELSDTELAAMAEHDESLADAAGRLGEDSFRKRITRLRDKIRADGGTTAAEQVVDDSFVRITPSADRHAHRIAACYDPIRGATIKAALARETKYLTEHPELCVGMTAAQVAAQALHDLIVRGDASDHSTLPRPSVQIHVLSDWDTLRSGPHDDTIAETFDGLPVGIGTLGRLCCDATMRRIATTADADVHVARPARSPSQPSELHSGRSIRTARSAVQAGNRSRIHVWPAATTLSSTRNHNTRSSASSCPSAVGGTTCGLRPPRVARSAHNIAAASATCPVPTGHRTEPSTHQSRSTNARRRGMSTSSRPEPTPAGTRRPRALRRLEHQLPAASNTPRGCAQVASFPDDT